jgi:glycerol kinase
MQIQPCVLAIDQGTTSTRSILFDARGKILFTAQREFKQHFPADGWVEHSPEDIISTALETAREALQSADSTGYRVAAIGISNQRETTVVWDRATGEPVYNAIVWQDRRTAEQCAQMKLAGQEKEIRCRTGLLLDPYFSASKVAWILDNVAGARGRAENGELAFGTIDSYLIFRLTNGARHVTDATNASRTSLFNIQSQSWDSELLRIFKVPDSLLPTVLDCTADFGMCDPRVLGRAIPIFGVAGDQQAAAIGQGCFEPGAIKSTYGTGCFVLSNTGDRVIESKNKLLSTVAYRLGGKTTYALEGSIFVAGAAVQWLRDGLKILDSAAETESLASSLDGNSGIYLVPAFTGLGAPHWDPLARGAIFGITRATGRAEFARAALESVCYQTADLLSAMADDGVSPAALKIDGGMAANSWLAQFLADIVDLPVARAPILETTALGAARLAGVKAGVYESLKAEAIEPMGGDSFQPDMSEAHRARLLAGWRESVAKVLSGTR